MTTRAVLVVLLVLGCRGTPNRDIVVNASGSGAPTASNPGSNPASPGASSDPVTCEAYFAHAERMTNIPHVGPYNEAEYTFCRSHTPEQLRCAVATTTVDELHLCEQFTDPARRPLGRKVTAEIKRGWPGTADVMPVLTGTLGCALVGVMGQDGLVLTETEALTVFAIRENNPKGDPDNILARMVRSDGGAWTCTESDPPHKCAYLASACRPSR